MLWFFDRWKRVAAGADEIARVLRMHGEPAWAAELHGIARRIRRRDYYGLERFLQCFGGSGTLNDLILMRNEKALARANTRLRRLTSKASNQASRLKRDIDHAQSR